MAIVTDGPMMAPERGIHELTTPLGASIGAAASEAWADAPVNQLITGSEIARASSGEMDFGSIAQGAAGGTDLAEEIKPARMDIIEANHRVRKAGLDKHLTLPDQPDIPPAQLDIMMRNAQARREREATIERGPQGFIPSALQVGTSFLVGAVDPINIASAFIPVMGELRYGKLLASAGESFAGRTSVRLGVGGAQGVVGQAALEPLDWWAHTQEGRDFGMADVLHNLLFGAALGGGLHAAGGGIRDVYRSRKGLAQYPFGPGEPMEHVDGIHVPESALEQPVAPAPPETVRFYHGHEGGNPAEGGARWVTPFEEYARNFRSDGRPKDVAYVDIPLERLKGDLADGFDEVNGYPRHFEAPEDIAKQLKPIQSSPAETPAINILRDLPPRAQEDSMRAAIASVVQGEPVKVGELLHAAAQTDPRIAESFEAFDDKLTTANGPEGRAPYLLVMDAAFARLRRKQLAEDRGAFLDRVSASLRADRELANDVAKAMGLIEGIGGGPKGAIYSAEEVSKSLADLSRGNNFVTEMIDDAISRSSSTPNYLDTPQNRLKTEALATANFLDSLQSRLKTEALRKMIDPRPDPVSEPRLVAERTEMPGQAAGNPKTTLPDPDLVTAPKPRGRAAADPETWSLFEYLASRGGLKPDPELKAIFGSERGPFVPGFGPLIRKGGMPLDEALRSAKDARYFFDAADVTGAEAKLTPRDLLDRIDDESRKRKVYRITHLPEDKPIDPDHEALQIVAALHDELESAAGQKGVHIDPGIERRIVEIVQKEGERDVLAAHERAIMEDAERYDAVAEARQAEPRDAAIPGWDVPDDTGAAQAAGRPAAGAGGLSGGPGQGAGRDAGLRSRAAGAGDRAPPQAQLDKDAAWRRLAAATPDFDAPDVVAASNAAAKAEPPKTKLDDRVAASEKAEAYARSMYDMFAHRLPPEERARLEEYIGELDRQKADRDTVTQRGAACLFEGGV